MNLEAETNGQTGRQAGSPRALSRMANLEFWYSGGVSVSSSVSYADLSSFYTPSLTGSLSPSLLVTLRIWHATNLNRGRSDTLRLVCGLLWLVDIIISIIIVIIIIVIIIFVINAPLERISYL